MNKAIMTMLLAALAISVFALDKPKDSPPKPKLISELLWDMTEYWQVVFGLDGKLKLSVGRRDAREVVCDGPEIESFEAMPMQAGWYSFVFKRVDVDGSGISRTGLMHTVMLHVGEADTHSTSVLISPKEDVKRSTVSAALQSKVNVRWSKGEAGGWDLLSTSYSDARLPSAEPGDEKTTKE